MARHTWVDGVCAAYLLRLIDKKGPFTGATMCHLEEANRVTRERFNRLMRNGDISQEGTPEEREVVRHSLSLQHQSVKLETTTHQELLERWRKQHMPWLLTTEKSSS